MAAIPKCLPIIRKQTYFFQKVFFYDLKILRGNERKGFIKWENKFHVELNLMTPKFTSPPPNKKEFQSSTTYFTSLNFYLLIVLLGLCKFIFTRFDNSCHWIKCLWRCAHFCVFSCVNFNNSHTKSISHEKSHEKLHIIGI